MSTKIKKIRELAAEITELRDDFETFVREHQDIFATYNLMATRLSDLVERYKLEMREYVRSTGDKTYTDKVLGASVTKPDDSIVWNGEQLAEVLGEDLVDTVFVKKVTYKVADEGALIRAAKRIGLQEKDLEVFYERKPQTPRVTIADKVLKDPWKSVDVLTK